ncbi:Na+/H+ antiporter NhaA [Arthrobacter bambusae]|uniref:Na(+)/H(+) antiporter NhaA n=1 Tax=Arthrobacter bambusae TaxID=1338426 RepID=A0AAW8D8M3_9MICC|nr:Na+/H+ antiporter NhaA [Arthrobacter bambusae]MDP9905261.1 NhaA family Na+:H+ antiporter [Arthrobacter bambusae]MDQ0129261.1 NhaA family Na+:H+ antiporter [Arthrobacter bambusae]MDQ0180393.1 NhaA family Na+:H+ antiporter [Arthrobacter bambusae]
MANRPHDAAPSRVFSRSSFPEYQRILAILRTETVGGALLLAATVAALAWANSPLANGYFALREVKIGYAPWHLELSLGHWASDGLLAVFFFIAGLELKREFVAGELRKPAKAIVPVAAAVGGVVLPALIYVVINLGSGAETLKGWAIPTATDIAFALAVLAVINTHLPAALRTFLLALAVVDDLIAIGIIAFFYSSGLQPFMLLAAAVPLALFTFLVQKRVRSWYLLLPLAAATWAFIHASGIHATVAGVLLGFAVPVVASGKNGEPAAGLAESFEHRLRPFSAGFAVPVFAFFSAGVALGGAEGLGAALRDPVAAGIVLALVAGKTAGVLGTTFLITKTTRARLDDGLAWIDVAGLAMLAGVGFTVSLLIAELGFGSGSPHDDHAKVAILAGSLAAAVLAAVVLKARNRHYRHVVREELRDDDGDGVPDVFTRA